MLVYILYAVIIATPQYLSSSPFHFCQPPPFVLNSLHSTLMFLPSLLLLLVCIQVVSVAVCCREDSIALRSSFSGPYTFTFFMQCYLERGNDKGVHLWANHSVVTNLQNCGQLWAFNFTIFWCLRLLWSGDSHTYLFI